MNFESFHQRELVTKSGSICILVGQKKVSSAREYPLANSRGSRKVLLTCPPWPVSLSPAEYRAIAAAVWAWTVIQARIVTRVQTGSRAQIMIWPLALDSPALYGRDENNVNTKQSPRLRRPG